MAEDITERKRAEEALKESEERYRTVVETALDAVITIDEESRIVFANPSAERIFGYTKAEMTGRPLTMLMPEHLRKLHLAGIKRHIESGERHIPWKAIEFPGLHKSGREIPLEISYGEFVKGGKYFFTGIVRDITERKQAEETIKYQAYHDLLTGLPNRAQLMLRLGIELIQAQHNRKELAVLHLDLDRFRTINDTLGHAVGDQVILAVAERLKSLIRVNDTLARIGSDEFIILVADLGRAEEAALFARKLVDAMRQPFRVNDHVLYATASIGISMYPEDSNNAGILLKNADIAVSHVKERGRNNYQFFNPALNRRTVERLLLESDLRQTIERGELVLHYQPQVSISTGEIMCLEALVRWKHADLGMLGPTQFIPAAEEIGFVATIDEWVLRTACIQNKSWQDAGYPPLCITVNLSAQQFQQTTLVDLVSGIVHETGLDPQYLGIEVTESTAMRDIDIAIPNLRGLHTMGIKLSIDDFGTGYSSLNYLKRFPIQKLKIDQSFIRGVAGDPDDQAIVNAVIAMGHNLQLRIIAEGVETDEQLSYLRSIDCDEMQGFLFSKPVPAEEFRGLIAARTELGDSR
jgi:diguanylate cyclase (GGDEF)-like protein/PAS domain S-box-containing protein